MFLALCQLASIYETPGIGFTQLCTSAWAGWFGLAWLERPRKNVAFDDVLGFLSGCFVVLSVWGVDRGGKYQVLLFFHLNSARNRQLAPTRPLVAYRLLCHVWPSPRNSLRSVKCSTSVGLRLPVNYGDNHYREFEGSQHGTSHSGQPSPYIEFLLFLAECYLSCLFSFTSVKRSISFSSLCFPIRYLYIDIPVERRELGNAKYELVSNVLV